MTTWLVRLNFRAGEREAGASVVERHVATLASMDGVEQLDFHVDVNDDTVLWAIWRLRSYDDMLAIYGDPAFRGFVADLKPLVIEHGAENFILSPLNDNA
jgi:quinol monooxygenase YgiN